MTKAVNLRSAPEPICEIPKEMFTVGRGVYEGRLNLLRERMQDAGLDFVVIYADKEHGANFSYLTGFSPRFEEGLLIVAPSGDANARASFVGLSATHSEGELVRAVLEGVGFGLGDSVELLRSAGWDGTSLRILGGGARSPLWKEIIASITGLSLETVNIDEGPALGAAILAGVGVGAYASVLEASDSIIKVEHTVEPNQAWQGVYQELHEVYKDLYPALKHAFDSLAKFS